MSSSSTETKTQFSLYISLVKNKDSFEACIELIHKIIRQRENSYTQIQVLTHNWGGGGIVSSRLYYFITHTNLNYSYTAKKETE